MNWVVDTESYSVEDYLAIDELLTDKASSTGNSYLRLGGFENEVFLPAWRTALDDIDSVTEDYDFSRRITDGSTIYCADNVLAYSIIMPTSEMPTKVFRDEVAPKLANALSEYGVENISVDDIYPGLRVGNKETPPDHPEGRQISGNAIRRKNQSFMCEGVITVDQWELPESLELREHEGQEEREEVGKLPYLSSFDTREGLESDLTQRVLDVFTDGSYEELELSGSEMAEVQRISQEKYGNPEWLKEPGPELESDQGFCMMGRYEDGFY